MEQMEEALDSAECIHRLVSNGDDDDDVDDNINDDNDDNCFYGDYILAQLAQVTAEAQTLYLYWLW